MAFHDYLTGDFFDELIMEGGNPRVGAMPLVKRIDELPTKELLRRQRLAESSLYGMGITFNVYGDDRATERIIPFDIVPRIIEDHVWDRVERGLKQRIEALNLFVDDCYHDRKIIKDKVVPEEFLGVTMSSEWCKGFTPPRGVWCHISGIDLARDRDGRFYVLEDNLRCPSGVSYVLENRRVLKRTFPSVFDTQHVRPVDDYPEKLLATLQYLAPDSIERPCVVVLTPGIYNSAYFEHAYLAAQMGVQLVEGSDLVVSDGYVKMRTTHGLERVDVIYRRIDDDFIDPKAFHPDSALGVPGIMEVYRNGRVALANAPGAGIADDKVIYAFVPDMIRYYLDQDPIIENVHTFICSRDDERAHVLANLDKLVVKPANDSGGKGIMVGPHATRKEHEEMAERIKADPRNYIAQPTLALSRAPTIINETLKGRHVDLRPYVLYGEEIFVLPGGLTRVALREGSLVVNSSQGGGTKDTWVVEAVEDAKALSQEQRGAAC